MRGYLADRRQLLQEAINHPESRNLPLADREALQRELAIVYRLRVFSTHVTVQFEREFRSQIDRGYSTLGLAVPRFGHMSRSEALAEIARFEEALRGRGSPPAEARELHDLLTRGLRNLSEDVVPRSWL